jgi:hypothetical protein
VRSYFGEWKILLQKVKIEAKPLILQKNVLSTNVFIGAHFTEYKLFETILVSLTPENLTPESGVGVGVDFFSGLGSGSGLPQKLSPGWCPPQHPGRAPAQKDRERRLKKFHSPPQRSAFIKATTFIINIMTLLNSEYCVHVYKPLKNARTN